MNRREFIKGALAAWAALPIAKITPSIAMISPDYIVTVTRKEFLPRLSQYCTHTVLYHTEAAPLELNGFQMLLPISTSDFMQDQLVLPDERTSE